MCAHTCVYMCVSMCVACEVSKFVDKTDLTREKIFWSKCITVATIYTSLGEARKHKHTENRHPYRFLVH